LLGGLILFGLDDVPGNAGKEDGETMSQGLRRACLMVLIVAAGSAAFADEPTAAIYRGWSKAVQFDVSPPLRSIPPLPIAPPPANLVEPDSGVILPMGPVVADPVVQAEAPRGEIPTPLISFDATPNILGYSPPDPVGEVGANHYVAMTNVYYSIYSKSGNLLYGPAGNNTLWTGFGGNCELRNDGDPVVLYDQHADRWILTQFTASAPYYNCVAISTTPDPLGRYYRYAFSTGANFPDYPKYGVWEDAYYISTREFAGSSFAGVGAYAVNRQDMIAGNPSPMMISFLAPPSGTGSGQNVGDGLLPSDLDGFTLPPAGSPNFYVGTMDNNRGATQDAITLWRFHADFVTPANSSFTLDHTIPTAAFNSTFPCSPTSRNCIPQPGTSQKVDILSYRRRPMNRLAYRNFGTHESLVTNQSVDAGSGIAGIRWYEIRDPDGATPYIYQQGTYAPGSSDGIHRWMGSIAMDNGGNMALGYSASNSSTYPSSWYTGRLAGDTLGSMTQGEGSFIDGTGSQTGSDRWGDYTDMTVDPADDCTFWYVNQYLPFNSPVGWKLRVGAFKFPECTPNGLALFMDGFESGTTGAWSQTAP
jgi:hypothetical protein